MKSLLSIVLFLVAAHQSISQYSLHDFDKSERKGFHFIRKQLNKIPESQQRSTFQIASYINDITTTDFEKAYATYYWVSRNITYDMKSLKANRTIPYKSHEVLQTKLAVCSGYAYLFYALCQDLGVATKVVDGYSKGYGYEEGDNFTMSNHSWNLVLINDKWFPVDATWAAPMSNSIDVSAYHPGPTDYFMENPKKFIVNHLPEDPKLQLLTPIISIDAFEKGTSTVQELSRYALVINNNEDNYLKYEEVAAHEVALKERALAFNPKNKNAVYKLGVAVLYQALDTMETMHQLNYYNVLTELPKYKYRIYELLDEAAHHFEGVPSSSPKEIYMSAQTFLSETTYQKGVFNYEAAQIIFDKTTDISREKILTEMEKLNTAMNQYYDIALEYFNRIESSSWYYENALSYINMIMQERENSLIR